MAKKKKIKPPVYPVRPENQKLLDACSTLNYQRIMAAIQAGGDVNTLDSKHEYAVIDSLTDAAVSIQEEYRNDVAIRKNVLKIITQLLALGQSRMVLHAGILHYVFSRGHCMIGKFVQR